MQKRSYQQACSLAVALDLIGERWTWLIIRGLLTGPKRYGELLDQLPGIGTNLLADRMKMLVETGLAEKSGRGRQAAYQLTELGEGLRAITHQLIRWGQQLQMQAGSTSRPEWDMLAIEAMFISEKAGDHHAMIELTLSGFTFHLVIRNQQCRAIAGLAVSPDVNAITDSQTLIALGSGELTVKQAEQSGALLLEGDRNVFNLLFELFG